MRFVFALMASVLVSSAAYAETPIKAGDKFSGHVPLKVEGAKDQQLPLPDGEWVVTATHRSNLQSGTVLSTVYMANVVDGKLAAAVRFRYAAENRSTGWKVSRICSRKSLNHREIAAAYDGTQTDCWGVSFTRGTSRPGSPGAKSDEYLNNLGVKLPIAMLYVEYSRADYAELLRIRYTFNPEFGGISPPENTRSFRDVDYHPARIGNYPKKKAYMDKIIEWGKAWKPKVDAGFKGKLKAN